jgi:hypothetical protein
MTYSTLRKQNHCRDERCEHSWYPRGIHISKKCPWCGSTKVSFTSLEHDREEAREAERRKEWRQVNLKRNHAYLRASYRWKQSSFVKRLFVTWHRVLEEAYEEEGLKLKDYLWKYDRYSDERWSGVSPLSKTDIEYAYQYWQDEGVDMMKPNRW